MPKPVDSTSSPGETRGTKPEAARPLSTADIKENLRRIGIDPQGILHIHLSLKSVGPLENGADTLLDALMDYMSEGLLVMPTHTWAGVRASQPVYDVLCSIPCIGWVPERFRHREGVIRSLHPTHSLAAAGRGAAELLAGQERFDTPCAPESSYGELLRRNAQVLLIGVDFARNTLIHCIEEIADVPNRLTPGHEELVSVDADGRRHRVPSRRHDNADSTNFVKLQPVMEQRGHLHRVKLGQADCFFFSGQDLLEDTMDMLAQDISLFEDLTPIPESWYLGLPEEAHAYAQNRFRKLETETALPLLQVHDSRRHLQTGDGQPFFWLGDTAWELFHALTREEVRWYLDDRAAKGFNVIQAAVLAELEGLTVPNAYGRLPLDPEELDAGQIIADTKGLYSYWDHVDYVLDMAAERGIYVGLLPTWGDKWNLAWGRGPVIFNPDNALEYGRWIGKRFSKRTNLVWVLGGDRRMETPAQNDTVQAMARGIEESTGHLQLMTLHPTGESSSLDHIGPVSWLDFHMNQSGHGQRYYDNAGLIQKVLRDDPDRPVLDAEPRYEDHPVGFKPENGLFDAADVRLAAYSSVLAGGFGVTYGHHSVWSMTREATDYFVMDWKEGVGRPGSFHMTWLKELFLSRPVFERRWSPELLVRNYPGAHTQVAARGEKYAFIYAPAGLPVHVRGRELPGTKLEGSWFNPRNGQKTALPVKDNREDMVFIPPSRGRLEDWVLILDSRD